MAIFKVILEVKVVLTSSPKNNLKDSWGKHKIIGQVGLGTTPPQVRSRDKPGLSLQQTQVFFFLRCGSPVCPRDKAGLSLGQTGVKGWQKKFSY